MKLPMLDADDKLAEIRRLYFQTTRQTIQDDLTKALDLLKSMGSEEERERALDTSHASSGRVSSTADYLDLRQRELFSAEILLVH